MGLSVIPTKCPDPTDEENIEAYIELCESIFPKNKIKPVRSKRPKKFINEADKVHWENEELHKCIYGDGLMCGSMYFYYNYCQRPY